MSSVSVQPESQSASDRDRAAYLLRQKFGTLYEPATEQALADRLCMNRTSWYQLRKGKAPGLNESHTTLFLRAGFSPAELRVCVSLFVRGVGQLLHLVEVLQCPIPDREPGRSCQGVLEDLCIACGINRYRLAELAGINRTTLYKQTHRRALTATPAADLARRLIGDRRDADAVSVLVLILKLLDSDLRRFLRAILELPDEPGPQSPEPQTSGSEPPDETSEPEELSDMGCAEAESSATTDDIPDRLPAKSEGNGGNACSGCVLACGNSLPDREAAFALLPVGIGQAPKNPPVTPSVVKKAPPDLSQAYRELGRFGGLQFLIRETHPEALIFRWPDSREERSFPDVTEISRPVSLWCRNIQVLGLRKRPGEAQRSVTEIRIGDTRLQYTIYDDRPPDLGPIPAP
jgi:hypothetical protein